MRSIKPILQSKEREFTVPIYEYRCQSCGSVKEMMQKISDPAPDSCPSCAQGPMIKLMSKTGFILKGTGWYVTDFRDSNKKPANDTAGKSSASDGASESVPQATPGTKSDAAPTTPSTPGTTGGDSKTTSSTPSPSASAPAPASKT